MLASRLHRYIRLLATLVICYGMAINIVEVTWKSRLKMAFPNPNDYSEFMGTFSSATGAVTLTMMLISQRIFKLFGWGIAALVTPTMIALTGGARRHHHHHLLHHHHLHHLRLHLQYASQPVSSSLQASSSASSSSTTRSSR